MDGIIKNLNKAKDETLGQKYVGAKEEIKELNEYTEVLRTEILNRIDKKGSREGTEKGEDGVLGQHLVLQAGIYSMKKEGRCSITINQEKAVKMFLDKGFENDMNIQTTIDIKKGVNPASIPKELLKEINKYFTMETQREVDKVTLQKKFQAEEITQKEYDSCLNKQWNYALKVV